MRGLSARREPLVSHNSRSRTCSITPSSGPSSGHARSEARRRLAQFLQGREVDGTKVDSLLYAGNGLGRARSLFEHAIKHRPRIRLTIRQQIQVLDQWRPPQRRTL